MDLTTIEIDVSSHGEAVLNGRLSKSQQRIIQQEQTKFSNSSLVPPPTYSEAMSSSQVKLGKSRSFRDSSSSNQKKQRQLVKYKKNKTTDLHKISSSSSMSHFSSSLAVPTSTVSSRPVGNVRKYTDPGDNRRYQEQSGQQQSTKRKTSFIQNVSSIFKNIR